MITEANFSIYSRSINIRDIIPKSVPTATPSSVDRLTIESSSVVFTRILQLNCVRSRRYKQRPADCQRLIDKETCPFQTWWRCWIVDDAPILNSKSIDAKTGVYWSCPRKWITASNYSHCIVLWTILGSFGCCAAGKWLGRHTSHHHHPRN